MATQVTFFRKSEAIAPAAERRQAMTGPADPFRLRPLPNDDIYFYAKRVDNSRVVRQADPSARGECWSAVGAAGLLLALGASIIAPHAASVLAGYKIESLRQERQTLVNEMRALDVQEAGLLSPARLNGLARARSLAPPKSDQVIHLDDVEANGNFARMETPPAQPLTSDNR